VELILVHDVPPEGGDSSDEAAGAARIRSVTTLDETEHLRPADPTVGTIQNG
jgi:hypothetical protein